MNLMIREYYGKVTRVCKRVTGEGKPTGISDKISAAEGSISDLWRANPHDMPRWSTCAGPAVAGRVALTSGGFSCIISCRREGITPGLAEPMRGD